MDRKSQFSLLSNRLFSNRYQSAARPAKTDTPPKKADSGPSFGCVGTRNGRTCASNSGVARSVGGSSGYIRNVTSHGSRAEIREAVDNGLLGGKLVTPIRGGDAKGGCLQQTGLPQPRFSEETRGAGLSGPGNLGRPCPACKVERGLGRISWK